MATVQYPDVATNYRVRVRVRGGGRRRGRCRVIDG